MAKYLYMKLKYSAFNWMLNFETRQCASRGRCFFKLNFTRSLDELELFHVFVCLYDLTYYENYAILNDGWALTPNSWQGAVA